MDLSTLRTSFFFSFVRGRTVFVCSRRCFSLSRYSFQRVYQPSEENAAQEVLERDKWIDAKEQPQESNKREVDNDSKVDDLVRGVDEILVLQDEQNRHHKARFRYTTIENNSTGVSILKHWQAKPKLFLILNIIFAI